MATKRARVDHCVADSPTGASAAVITEIYDCLMQVSRKQLACLLSVLLKACPAAALDTVREAAIKSGALVPTPSRYQSASHSLLDACFSFLDKRDLRVVEIVCARWRHACLDSGAGWRRWLCSATTTSDWLHEMHRLRLKPESLSAMQSAVLLRSSTGRLVRAVSRLPSLQRMDIQCELSGEAMLQLSQLKGLVRVRLWSSPQLDAFLSAEPAQSWQELKLAFTPTKEQLTKLSQLPDLHTLRTFVPSAAAFAPLSSFPKLAVLSLDLVARTRVDANLLDSLTQLPTLTHLELHTDARNEDVPVLESSAFATLGRLTNLKQLMLPSVDVHNDPNVLAPLAALRNLTTLNTPKLFLEGTFSRVSVLQCSFVLMLTNLTKLDGLPCAISDDGLRLLEPLKRLEHLILWVWGDISAVSFSPVATLTALQTIELRQCRFSEEAHGVLSAVSAGRIKSENTVKAVLTREKLLTILSAPALQNMRVNDYTFTQSAGQLSKLRELLNALPPSATAPTSSSSSSSSSASCPSSCASVSASASASASSSATASASSSASATVATSASTMTDTAPTSVDAAPSASVASSASSSSEQLAQAQPEQAAAQPAQPMETDTPAAAATVSSSSSSSSSTASAQVATMTDVAATSADQPAHQRQQQQQQQQQRQPMEVDSSGDVDIGSGGQSAVSSCGACPGSSSSS